jgi:ketosteroid isomerase-like protein
MSAVTDQDRRERAHATFKRAVQLLLDHDMTGFAMLWAPTGTMDFPFAGAGQPQHLDSREAVVEYLRHYTDIADVHGATVHAVHFTLDPDTIVVEFEATGVVVATGRDYRMPYIAVITVGEAGIVSYRDYWSMSMIAPAIDPASAEAGAPA